jgi:hypothetical protein
MKYNKFAADAGNPYVMYSFALDEDIEPQLVKKKQ